MVQLSSLFLCATTIATALAIIDERNFPASKIITKDVAIIGGGASGTYAAVKLREDLNTSIIVVETEAILGGHADTYTVPGTGEAVEYGVQTYVPYGPGKSFFSRFAIETGSSPNRPLTAITVDYETSKILSGYIPPSANATNEAFQRWLPIVEKYDSLIEPGYWNFPKPKDIPEDFLLPFGEFAKKYNLEAAGPRISQISNAGSFGIEKTLALHVIQHFGLPISKTLISGTFFKPVVSNNLLYERALELLKKDVLLNSYVSEAERERSGIKLVVKNVDGKPGATLIKAKRLLFTAAPRRLDILQNFDEDKKEIEVFDPLEQTWRFAGVAKIPCIPENYSVSFISSAAVPDHYLKIRDYPWSLGFTSTGPVGLGLFRVLFGIKDPSTIDEAKSFISSKVQDLVKAGSLNYTGECKVDYKAFVDHNGVLWPDAEELKKGWVQKLNGLQGHRSTWWTGGYWCSDYTTNVWAFTDTVLERLLKSLGRKY
jgi:hypothetical protein